MFLLVHFSVVTLLVTIALLTPLVIYLVKAPSIHSYIDPISTIDNPAGFDDLAPIDNTDQSEAQLKSLRWALGNPKVRNIALTGPYGSGKSSLLATFRKAYPSDFTYLDISLASFTDLNAAEEDENPLIPSPGGTEIRQAERQERHKNESQQLIELSVLQQIFYKVDQADIPDSRFKRITLINKEELRYFIAGVFAFIAGLLSLVFPSEVRKLSAIDDFATEHPDAWFILITGMLLPGLIWLTASAFRFSKRSGLKKLNISSGEIEIDPKSEGSILNKYLDELVYFFSATKFNVVLIEDMDRFNDPDIFTKLRELNTLLNNSSQIHRRIVFVYAIKDNLFQDERTRTKFFDFIVPVIPIINWSNSLTKLKEKLDKAGFEIEPRFITSITLYIDDMRVLKNIFNELLLYNETLQITAHRQTKLLAMIAYKNIYPNDFADLHEERGMVYKVFSQALTERENIVKDFDMAIALKEKAITDAKATLPYNIKELRAAYIQAIVDQCVNFSSFFFDGNRQLIREMYKDEYFNILKSGKAVKFINSNHNSTSAVYNFSEIEKEVFPSLTYDQRETAFRNNTESGLAKIQQEIKELRAEQAKVAAYSVTQIIQSRIESFDALSFEMPENRLLRHLLSEGYIDLSYPYLISYFYPGTIGRADLNFLMSVNDRRPLPFEYALEKPAGIVEMLADYDYDKEAILNIHLLDELLSRRGVLAEIGNKVLAQLSSAKDRQSQFVTTYVEKGKYVGTFINLLSKQWNGLFSHFYAKGDDAQTLQYLKLIMFHADLSDLKLLNADGNMSVFMGDNFLEIATITKGFNKGVIQPILAELAIKFKKLDSSLTDQTLFDLAYDENYYSLNLDNIQSIVTAKNKKTSAINNLQTANYSTIVSSDCQRLKTYIAHDPNNYVQNVLLQLGAPLTDSPTDIIALLNDKHLVLENKQHLVPKITAIIEDISSIDYPELYPDLLSNFKIKPIWLNLLKYYKGSIDASLLKYMNHLPNATALGLKKLKASQQFNKKQVDAFELAMLLADGLSLVAYKKLIRSIVGSYSDLNTDSLAYDKVKELIYEGIIALSSVNYARLKIHHSNLHLHLLMNNLDEYIDDTAAYEVNSDERLLMLKEQQFSVADKMRLIAVTTPNIIRTSSALATQINAIIVNSLNLSLEEEKLKALIDTGEEQGTKIILFDHHLAELTPKVARELLNGIGGDFKKLNAGKHPTFPADDLHKRIALLLENKRIISSATPVKGKPLLAFRGRAA